MSSGINIRHGDVSNSTRFCHGVNVGEMFFSCLTPAPGLKKVEFPAVFNTFTSLVRFATSLLFSLLSPSARFHDDEPVGQVSGLLDIRLLVLIDEQCAQHDE